MYAHEHHLKITVNHQVKQNQNQVLNFVYISLFSPFRLDRDTDQARFTDQTALGHVKDFMGVIFSLNFSSVFEDVINNCILSV